MGLFEKSIGLGLIPAELFILFLLAMGQRLSLLNSIILKIIGVEIKIGSTSLKLMHIITCVHLFQIFVCLNKLHGLKVLNVRVDDTGKETNTDKYQKEMYLTDLYHTYRNCLLNIASITLIICLNIATSQFEKFLVVKDAIEKLEKDKRKVENK